MMGAANFVDFLELLILGEIKKAENPLFIYYFEASSIATAHATVIPTMGLLPAPMRPIISLGISKKCLQL